MAIKAENTAAVNAMSHPDSAYEPDNLIRYHTTLALVEKLVEDGALTHADYRRSCTILSRKYGIPSDGIFAETA